MADAVTPAEDVLILLGVEVTVTSVATRMMTVGNGVDCISVNSEVIDVIVFVCVVPPTESWTCMVGKPDPQMSRDMTKPTK